MNGTATRTPARQAEQQAARPAGQQAEQQAARPAGQQAGQQAGPQAGREPVPASALPSVAEMRLPVWFFGFEGVLAGAFDLLRAAPSAWPALVALAAVNIGVSLTLMRRRLKLAKLLWRGKGTRKVALGLVGLRLGSHLVLGLLGTAVTSAPGHVLFALVMGAVTVALLVHVQRTALGALVAAGKAAA
ncbi:hypothetical protein [Kitasatospora phosalacinea]|uniref:Uncharacterized protein n=1 Tax=Kitasatospora phosalacinea TaxID=2065 RepID=A0A9W6PGA8_9ACTN|nr:hypothetical protein [Kitasatospora phosalacinea]GLW54520.1 hypothetical protein Kpho01_25310 [Kitasatospora phosalacinea]